MLEVKGCEVKEAMDEKNTIKEWLLQKMRMRKGYYKMHTVQR